MISLSCRMIIDIFKLFDYLLQIFYLYLLLVAFSLYLLIIRSNIILHFRYAYLELGDHLQMIFFLAAKSKQLSLYLFYYCVSFLQFNFVDIYLVFKILYDFAKFIIL